MKKFIVFFIALVAMCVIKAKAQTSLLATLNHEGTVSTFYGSTALQQAHEAAANGDVITLSSGTFLSVDITKAVTLRGAGMTLDAATQTEPTVLANDFKITIDDEVTDRLTIEGIYSNQQITIDNLKNAMFLKDRIRRISISGRDLYAKDLTFIHCRITETYSGSYESNNSATFQNCIVSYISGNNYSFKNCLVGGNNVSTGLCDNSEYKNCVLIEPYAYRNSMTMYNNLYLSSSQLDCPNNTNVQLSTDDERVKNLLTYSDDNDYKLTEEAKSIMKGTDGTEVGIYGGSIPYDPTPTNPQISKFNVAAKTTADGKLSVDIEVKSAE